MLEQIDIIPAKLDDETTIQVSVINLGGEVDVATGEVLFSEVMSTIESLGQALVTTLSKVNPDKASVEFGLGLATKEGKLTALLVQGSLEASLKITLEWTSDEKKAPAKK